jgi:DNA-binding response OmpR family regulator
MTEEKLRILAVDDDNDILELVRMTLSPKYEVLTVNDPVTACDTLDIFEPDLVVLDIMMPKVTGYQIIEFMKKNPKFAHVLVIFLSAKDTARDIKYGYKLGANLYLPKPFQPERLLRNVESLLSHYEPRKKTLSMRDVSLRLQLKLSLGGSVPRPLDTPAPDAAPGEQTPFPSRLRRPLAQEHEEQERKKWIG